MSLSLSGIPSFLMDDRLAEPKPVIAPRPSKVQIAMLQQLVAAQVISPSVLNFKAEKAEKCGLVARIAKFFGFSVPSTTSQALQPKTSPTAPTVQPLSAPVSDSALVRQRAFSDSVVEALRKEEIAKMVASSSPAPVVEKKSVKFAETNPVRTFSDERQVDRKQPMKRDAAEAVVKVRGFTAKEVIILGKFRELLQNPSVSLEDRISIESKMSAMREKLLERNKGLKDEDQLQKLSAMIGQ